MVSGNHVVGLEQVDERVEKLVGPQAQLETTTATTATASSGPLAPRTQ